jgi:hypothetical protein
MKQLGGSAEGCLVGFQSNLDYFLDHFIGRPSQTGFIASGLPQHHLWGLFAPPPLLVGPVTVSYSARNMDMQIRTESGFSLVFAAIERSPSAHWGGPMGCL